MLIRQVKISDNQILANIIREVFHEFSAPKQGTVYSDPTTDNLYGLFQPEKSVLWVAELDGKIVGCCGIYPTDALPEGCVELVKLYISSEARGKGVGKELMLQSIDSARRFGYKSIYLESLPVFDKAIELYEKNGFRLLDAPLGCSGHTTCNVWMIKELDGRVV